MRIFKRILALNPNIKQKEIHTHAFLPNNIIFYTQSTHDRNKYIQCLCAQSQQQKYHIKAEKLIFTTLTHSHMPSALNVLTVFFFSSIFREGKTRAI